MSEDERAHVGADEIDRNLRALAKRRAGLDAEEARWLLLAQRERVHAALGYGSFVEYIERVLGYQPRTTLDRVRVAGALEDLPRTAAALAGGGIAYSAVRELTRVANAETEQAWLAAVAGKTMREIETLTAGHVPGDLPTDPGDPDLEPRLLRLELTPDVYAAFLAARRAIETDAGEPLDDSAVMSVLCSGGAPRPQIAISVCARCEHASQDAAGQVIDIDRAARAMAECDAAHVSTEGAVTLDIPAKLRRAVERRDHGRCPVPGCRSRHIDIHHLEHRANGGAHAFENLTLLCKAHHRMHHRGELIIRGTPPHLTFFHADGRPYGSTAQTSHDIGVALHGPGSH